MFVMKSRSSSGMQTLFFIQNTLSWMFIMLSEASLQRAVRRLCEVRPTFQALTCSPPHLVFYFAAVIIIIPSAKFYSLVSNYYYDWLWMLVLFFISLDFCPHIYCWLSITSDHLGGGCPVDLEQEMSKGRTHLSASCSHPLLSTPLPSCFACSIMTGGASLTTWLPYQTSRLVSGWLR